MSFFVITGFFAVVNGRRITVQRSNKSVPYAVYDTAINFAAEPQPENAKHAEIRVYCSASQPIYPNQSIFYVVAKACFPNDPTLPALLDPIIFSVVPGDPTLQGYESHIPDCPYPCILALGSVGPAHSAISDLERVFPLNVGAYIFDDTRPSLIM